MIEYDQLQQMNLEKLELKRAKNVPLILCAAFLVKLRGSIIWFSKGHPHEKTQLLTTSGKIQETSNSFC